MRCVCSAHGEKIRLLHISSEAMDLRTVPLKCSVFELIVLCFEDWKVVNVSAVCWIAALHHTQQQRNRTQYICSEKWCGEINISIQKHLVGSKAVFWRRCMKCIPVLVCWFPNSYVCDVKVGWRL